MLIINLIYKTVLLYFIIIIAYRIMGKKEIGELGVVDFIVTVLIAELAAISIEEEKISIIVSVVPICSLVILQILISYISMKSNKIRDIIDGKPTIIIKGGKLVFSEMAKLKYTLDDLLSQLREKGIESIEKVDYAILENNGQLSVFQNTKDYPLPIVMDGVLNKEILNEIGKTEKWFNKLLRDNHVDLKNIFYAFYRKNKTYIIKKTDLL